MGYAGTKATGAEELGACSFGAGTMLMFAVLALASGWMKARARSAPGTQPLQIGVRNVVRRPGRSLAVLGMMAGGIFLCGGELLRLSPIPIHECAPTGTSGLS